MKLSPFEDTLSLFSNLMNEMIPDGPEYWAPKLSITEHEHQFVIECELPGVGAEDIQLDVQDQILEISGERIRPEVMDGHLVRVDERNWGKFRRRIRLDNSVDRTAIEADYKDGILIITAARAAESRPRSIAIRPVSSD